METPLKSTRRKMKKVLKKTRANLSISTGNIYQKKLKSAINVSLNSTRTVRTLQANNRSLATSLEKMRQDFRQVHDHYTLLLEENHELREKILELKRIDVTERHIEREVNKRFQAHSETVRKKLGVLSDLATKFLDTLSELSDIYSLSKSPTFDDLSSSESSNHNCSLLPNIQIHSNDVSLIGASDTELTESGVRPELDMENADFNKNPHQLKVQVHDMTLIMEQSVCPSPESISAPVHKLDTVSENSLAVTCYRDKQTAATKLPIRVPKQTVQQKEQMNEEVVKGIEKLNTKKGAESPKQILRRETFVLTTNEPPDVGLLTDIAMPQFLVSNMSVENELMNIQDSVLLPLSTDKIKQSGGKNNRKESTKRLSQVSPNPAYPEISHNEQSSTKLSPRYQMSPSPKRMRQIRKRSLPRTTRSRSKPEQKSAQSPVMRQVAEKQKTNKASPVNQKPISQASKKNNPASPKKKSPKNLLKPGDKQNQNLFISNEFNLINMHKEKMDNKGNSTINQICQPFQEAEHTIFPVDDMELTRMEEELLTAPGKSVKRASTILASNNRKSTESELTANSRSKSKQTGQTLIEAEECTEEKVPDAVTMRFTKPGQFVFAASRKESDGTRKNLPLVVPKTRSKSKKQLSDMIENLPETVPQSIFDFHDKTPAPLNSEKQVTSVFNISADESSLSPLTSLNRNRSRFNNFSSSTSELSSISALQSRNSEGNKKTHPLLNESFTFEVPAKDESPAAKSTYGTRSRSRGRKQYDSESCKMEVQACSQSRKRWVQTQVESPVNLKTSSLTTASSEALTTNLSSHQSFDLHSRTRSSTELMSSDSKSETFIAASHLGSNALYKQVELNCEKETQAKTRDNALLASTRISSPEDPNIKTRSRRYAEKNRGQNIASEAEENKTAIFTSAIEPFALRTAENKTEKECMDLLDTDSNNVKESDTLKQRGENKCLASSGACSSESQCTNYFIPGIIMSGISTGSDEKCDYQEVTTARKDLKSSEMFNSETFSGTTLRRKKKPRSRSTSQNTRENSLYIAHTVTDDLETLSSEIASSEIANFISTRTDKTRGRKRKDKGSGESEITSDSKSLELSIDDLAADGDSIIKTKFTEMKDLWNGTDAKILEESSQLLGNLRHLRTPILSHSEENVHSGIISPSNKDVTPQHPRMSRIVRVPPSSKLSLTKRPSPESSSVGGKRRRAATAVNYAEASLAAKLRRGDPHTSHYCTTDKIEIYKSPKSKAKKKVVRRNILGPLHNHSITEEIVQ